MLDLLIRGGEVVTPQGVGKWSVGVQGEKIAFIGTDEQAPQAGRTIDASGKIVVPGGIEPHAHLDIYDLTNPDAGVSTLGPEEDTRGMAFGGTTTHLDFCFIEPGMDITQAIETRSARWKGQSYVDYSFHVGLMGALPLSVFDQIGDVIKQGFPSFKIFTTDVMPPHPKRSGCGSTSGASSSRWRRSRSTTESWSCMPRTTTWSSSITRDSPPRAGPKDGT